MKRLLSALLVCMLLLCGALAEEGENLISNGDFSRVDALGLPEDWTRDMWYTDAGVSNLYVSPEGVDGNCAVVLNADPNDARFAQTIPVEPETLYRFSCMMRAEDFGGTGIGATISFQNTFVYSDELYDTNGNWNEVCLYGYTGEDQTELTVFLRMGGYGNLASGKAWFDNVECVRVDESEIPDDVTVFALSPEESSGGSASNAETEEGEPARHTELFLLLAFIYAVIVLAFARRRARFPETDAKKSGVVFLLIALAALVLRLFVSGRVPGYHTDVNCFTAWGDRMLANGPLNYYEEGYFCDYPPLYMLLLAIPAGLRALFGAPYWSALQLILLKLIPVLCDIAGAYVVWRFARRRALGERAALLLAAFYAFNPAAIIDSAAWGQIDAVFTLLLVLCALRAVDEKYTSALIAFALAVLIKPQALLFAPVGLFMMLVWLVRGDRRDAAHARRMRIDALRGLLCALGIIYLTGLTFTLGRANGVADALVRPVSSLWELYGGTLGSYEYITINALNLYELFDLNWRGIAGATGWAVLAWALFALSYLYAFLLCIKSRKRSHLLLIGGMLIMLVYTFGPKIHDRYVFPALLLLTLAYAAERDRRILLSLTALTVTLSLNELLVLQGGMGTGNFGHLQSSEQAINALLSLVNVANALYMVYIAADVCLAGHTVPVEDLTRLRLPNVKAGDGGLHLRRAEYLMMALVTLVYGVLAFTNLGDTKAPQTSWIASRGGENVTFDLGAKERFRMMYYGGICKTNFTVELSNDAENWTEPCYALYDEGQIFRWMYYTPLDEDGDTIYGDAVDPGDGSAFITYSNHSGEAPYQTARYVRITALSAGLNLSEIGFKREDGSLAEIKGLTRAGELEETATDPQALIDEQDIVPERPSYMNSTYFDEIYHARTGYELLHGLSVYEWTHPPLGKLLIMAGIRLFGMTPFGWRFAGALFGVMMVPLMYLLAKQITKSSKLSFVAMLLLAADAMHFTQSRIATIDSYVVFWIMLEYLFMIRYLQTDWHDRSLVKTLVPLGLCGITMGLAFASKWNGIYSGIGLALLFFAKLVRERMAYADDKKTFWRRTLVTVLFCLVFFIVIPALIYFFSYARQLRFEGAATFKDLFSKRWIGRVVKLQKDMLSYHAGLGGDTHPFRSPWYEWPVIARPMWYYSGSEHLDNSMVTSISCMGNPAVWWTGLVALLSLILYSAWRPRARREWLWIITGFAVVYLPWVFVPRSMFIYHYFPCVPFLILAIVAVIGEISRRSPRAADAICVVVAGAAMLLFAAFYPLESGVPAPRSYVRFLRWFNWINY